MSVRTAASATDRLDGAAAAPAGLESAAREVSLLMSVAKLMRLQKLWHHGIRWKLLDGPDCVLSFIPTSDFQSVLSV